MKILGTGMVPKPFGASFGALLDLGTSGYRHPRIITSTDPTLTSTLLDPASGKPCLNGGGDLRLSLDRFGATRLPIAVLNCVVDATPANRLLELYLGGTGARFIYLWWGIPGATQPAETANYGAKTVFGQASPDSTFCSVVALGVDNGNDVKDYSPMATLADWVKTAINQPLEVAGPVSPLKAQDHTGGASHYYYQPYSAKLSSGVIGFSYTCFVGWFKWNDAGGITGTPVLVSNKTSSGAAEGFEIGLTGVANEIIIRVGGASNVVVTLPFSWTDTNWHLLSIRLSDAGNTAIQVYADNAFVSAPGNIGAWVASTNDLVIGQNTAFTASKFDGYSMYCFMGQNNDFINGTFQIKEYQSVMDPTSLMTVTYIA